MKSDIQLHVLAIVNRMSHTSIWYLFERYQKGKIRHQLIFFRLFISSSSSIIGFVDLKVSKEPLDADKKKNSQDWIELRKILNQ